MKQSIWADICQFLIKNAGLLTILTAASAVKIMIDNRIKKISTTAKIMKFIIAMFCGVWASWYFISTGQPDKAIWAGPGATLGGEGLLVWLTMNSTKIWNVVFKKYSGNNKDTDKTDTI